MASMWLVRVLCLFSGSAEHTAQRLCMLHQVIAFDQDTVPSLARAKQLMLSCLDLNDLLLHTANRFDAVINYNYICFGK